ncbi:MAG: transporter substrate-binding domain-containing protein [Pseudomonadota bacterium]
MTELIEQENHMQTAFASSQLTVYSCAVFAAVAVLTSVCSVRAAEASTTKKIDCGTKYTVNAGDKIESIAERAYGRRTKYQPIISLNRLEDPRFLPIGSQIEIPCLPGMKPPASLVQTKLSPIRQSVGSEVKILTGFDYAPFVGSDLLNKGMSYELVQRSLQAASKKLNYKIDMLPDWGTHLRPKLEDGDYDIAFPWFKPDCSEYGKLGSASRWRCDNLRFSDPLHEVVVTFYARLDDRRPASTSNDLKGRTICRPDGYFVFDLEAKGLKEPFIKRVAPESPDDCFRMLVEGKTDYVTVNSETGDAAITKLNYRGVVQELVDLASVQTLHAVTMFDHPRARPLLLRITQGLRQLQRTGEYRSVVRVHLRSGRQ